MLRTTLLRLGFVALVALALLVFGLEPFFVIVAVAGFCFGALIGAGALTPLFRGILRGGLAMTAYGGIVYGLTTLSAFAMGLGMGGCSPNLVGPGYTVTYSATIEYQPKLAVWSIHEQIDVPKSHDIETVLGHKVSEAAVSCGWQYAGSVNSVPRFHHVREQRCWTRWFPWKTVNVIPFPASTCEGISFLPDTATSSLTVVAPKLVVGETYPPARTRSDYLSDDAEKITIPLDYESQYEESLVRLNVISPLLRTPVTNFLTKTGAWEVANVLIFATFAAFADGIKRKVLVPIVDRSLRVFRFLGRGLKPRSLRSRDKRRH